jgi:hypothetical protein
LTYTSTKSKAPQPTIRILWHPSTAPSFAGTRTRVHFAGGYGQTARGGMSEVASCRRSIRRTAALSARFSARSPAARISRNITSQSMVRASARDQRSALIEEALGVGRAFKGLGMGTVPGFPKKARPTASFWGLHAHLHSENRAATSLPFCSKNESTTRAESLRATGSIGED